jgi:SOS response regulatory protein OraA/RecX
LEQRQQFGPRGARLLQAELRQHGVDAELASATASRTLETAADDAYRTGRKRAMQLAAAAVDGRTFRTRLGQLLARRGFDWDTIAPVVERLWLSSRGEAEGSQVMPRDSSLRSE